MVEANIARTNTEKTVERLTTARDALDGKTRDLEQGRAALLDRSNNLAEALKARETSLAHAEQKIKVLTDRIAEMEAEANAYRAKAERRIDELSASLQRERVELAVAQGALETTRGTTRGCNATFWPGGRRSSGPQSRSGIGYDQRAAEDRKTAKAPAAAQGRRGGAGGRRGGAHVHAIASRD